MIRQRLHRRWARDVSDGELLMRTLIRHKTGGPLARYFDWHVSRYGDRGKGPLALRPIGRLLVWAEDWRTTLAIRPPTPAGVLHRGPRR